MKMNMKIVVIIIGIILVGLAYYGATLPQASIVQNDKSSDYALWTATQDSVGQGQSFILDETSLDNVVLYIKAQSGCNPVTFRFRLYTDPPVEGAQFWTYQAAFYYLGRKKSSNKTH